MATHEAGGVPKLAELRLHNGTVYRWNRPIYEVVEEARTCGSRTASCPRARPWSTRSPTRPSTTASSASWPMTSNRCGRGCPSRPPRRTPYGGARGDRGGRLLARRRRGAGGRARAPPPAAARLRGPGPLGLDPDDRDRLLGIVERRCATLRNGATWQSATFRRLTRDRGLDRPEALRRMTVAYRDHMHSNQPVHDWPLD